jgi:hypothetical protein
VTKILRSIANTAGQPPPANAIFEYVEFKPGGKVNVVQAALHRIIMEHAIQFQTATIPMAMGEKNKPPCAEDGGKYTHLRADKDENSRKHEDKPVAKGNASNPTPTQS